MWTDWHLEEIQIAARHIFQLCSGDSSFANLFRKPDSISFKQDTDNEVQIYCMKLCKPHVFSKARRPINKCGYELKHNLQSSIVLALHHTLYLRPWKRRRNCINLEHVESPSADEMQQIRSETLREYYCILLELKFCTTAPCTVMLGASKGWFQRVVETYTLLYFISKVWRHQDEKYSGSTVCMLNTFYAHVLGAQAPAAKTFL